MREVLKSSICKKCVKLILMLFLLFFTVTSVYPLIWLVFFSFKSNQEIFGGNIMGPPENWLVKNYENALLGGKVLRYLGNSIMVAVVVIVISTVLISMVAYAVTRMKWKLRGAAYWFFMAGLTIPIHATLLPLFIVRRWRSLYPILCLRFLLGSWYWAIIILLCRMRWKRQPV